MDNLTKKPLCKAEFEVVGLDLYSTHLTCLKGTDARKEITDKRSIGSSFSELLLDREQTCRILCASTVGLVNWTPSTTLDSNAGRAWVPWIQPPCLPKKLLLLILTILPGALVELPHNLSSQSHPAKPRRRKREQQLMVKPRTVKKAQARKRYSFFFSLFSFFFWGRNWNMHWSNMLFFPLPLG